MTDEQTKTEDQQPAIPVELAALVQGLDANRAALIGVAFAGQNPGYAERETQQAATNVLSSRELDLCRRANMQPADYLHHKNAGSDPIDSR